MARLSRGDYQKLKKLSEQLERLEKIDIDKLCRAGAKKIASEVLGRVKRRTPEGVKPGWVSKETLAKYWSGYSGGKLRDAWTVGEIERRGNNYEIAVINPLEYASYVEYGHRQTPGRKVGAIERRLKAGWVRGRFMLTLSVQEVERGAPAMLEKMVEKALREAFNNAE